MDELSPIVIDLNKAREGKLDESWLAMLGWGVKKILKAILRDFSIPVELKGNPSDVRSFMGALGAEKGHIQALKDFGLNSPRTYRSKSELDGAISKFERKTGIPWPFK